MKNNIIKFVTISLLAAVAFLVYPKTIDNGSQSTKVTAQDLTVEYEADTSAYMPGLELL